MSYQNEVKFDMLSRNLVMHAHRSSLFVSHRLPISSSDTGSTDLPVAVEVSPKGSF